MNDRLTAINADVAAAADAWLNDPLDAGIYARLVTALRTRRTVLSGPELTPPSISPAVPEDGPDGPELSEEDHGSVRPVSDLLSGDPRAALERLRRGRG